MPNRIQGIKFLRWQIIRYLVTATYIFVFLICSMLAKADEGAILYQQCIVCHGDKGQGNIQLKAPAIAGQHAFYIQRQLKLFSQNIRGSHKDDVNGNQMSEVAKLIPSENDFATIAQHVQSFPSLEALNDVQGDLKNGSRYYQGKCGACHGGKGQGNKSFNAPKLSGLDSAYLKIQMEKFVNGIRGSHPKDKFGKQMAMMAKTTSGAELDDIIFYLSQQKVQVK